MTSIELGPLWEKKDKNGKKYLSGVLNIFPYGQVNVTIFKNDYKTKDNQPDYKIYYSPNGQQNGGPYGGDGTPF